MDRPGPSIPPQFRPPIVILMVIPVRHPLGVSRRCRCCPHLRCRPAICIGLRSGDAVAGDASRTTATWTTSFWVFVGHTNPHEDTTTPTVDTQLFRLSHCCGSHHEQYYDYIHHHTASTIHHIHRANQFPLNFTIPIY